MSYKTIRYECDSGLAHILLNRPEAGNAVNLQMAIELKEVCNQLNQDEHARAVLISGSGDSFCSGEETEECTKVEFFENCNVAEALSRVELPIICAVNGEAIGIGLAIALACDVRIASDKSFFGIARTGEDYVMPIGITQLLPRIVGKGKALEMMLLSERIDAQEAYRIGLIHKVVPHQELVAETQNTGEKMAVKAPIALKYAKETVCKGLDLTLEQGLRLECDMYMILHTTMDRTERIRAFVEKRPPEFRGI